MPADPPAEPPPAEPPPAEPGHAAEAVLAGLPDELWTPLLKAFRRAADQQPRAELPVAVRPFAGWKPERLTGEHPRRVLARALATDARLRQAVAEQLAEEEELRQVAAAGVDELVAGRGEPMAAALLAVSQRWDDLARVSGEALERVARRRHDAELSHVRREWKAAAGARARLERDLDSARTQRDRLRRRAVAAESRAEAAATELEGLRAEAGRLRDEVRRLEGALETAHDRAARKLRSAQARAARAEQRARSEAERARELAEQLSALAAELRAVREVPAPPGGERPEQAGTPGLPRAVPAAQPGRPCRFPPGLSADTPEGVLAVLHSRQVPLLVDGYNVTKHARGLPKGTLEQQRRWLVGIAGGVVARFGVRVTVAFDGAEVGSAPATSARGVQVAFSEPDETADDLIVALLDSRPATEPVVVVTDDRDLRARVRDFDADVAGVRPFLLAVGA